MSADVSVVIPTFNAAEMIGGQLAALARQTWTAPLEVVVADNGSTDDLESALRPWQRVFPGLRRVDASRGRGVSVARNVGVEAASGTRILLCDADDVVCDRWVEAMAEALTRHALVGGAVETIRLSGPSAVWVPIESHSEELPRTWRDRPYPYGGNTGMRREVFERVGGYDESYPAGAEEIDFAWRAADLGYDAVYVPDALLHYRIRTDVRGVLRQQYNSGRGTATLYAKFRPAEVTPKAWHRRVRHEALLLRQFPWRGGPDARRSWAALMAFEAGKLREARALRVPAP